MPSWPRRPSSSTMVLNAPIAHVLPGAAEGLLPFSIRQPVGSLDVTQVLDLQGTLRAGGDVAQHVGQQPAMA